MHVDKVGSYNALNNAIEHGAWCYSLDGKSIESANTFWEKVCYVCRSVIFSNGTNKTLKSAILNSFSPPDQALLQEKLQSMKISKKDAPITEVDSIVSTALDTVLPEDLLNPKDSEKEFSLENLEALAKVHKIFKKIYGVAQEICGEIEKKTNEMRNQELTELLHSISSVPKNVGSEGAQRFQESFFEHELKNAPFFGDLFKFCKYSNQLRSQSNLDPSLTMDQVMDFLACANCCLEQIDKEINSEEDPSENLIAFRNIVLFESSINKVNVMFRGIQSHIRLEEYKKLGPEYANRWVIFCMLYFPQMTDGDQQLFKKCISEHIRSCQAAFALAQQDKSS